MGKKHGRDSHSGVNNIASLVLAFLLSLLFLAATVLVALRVGVLPVKRFQGFIDQITGRCMIVRAIPDPIIDS